MQTNGILWRFSLFLLFTVFGVTLISAQANWDYALISGPGFIHEEQVVNGVPFTPFLITGFISRPFRRGHRLLRPSSFSWYAAPQVNPVLFEGKVEEMEAGVNLGLQWSPVEIPVRPFVRVGVGPHYLSFSTARQRGGFIFSDNFATGIIAKIGANAVMEVQYRYRHLSNAGLKDPNWGIDNHFALVGFHWAFGEKNENHDYFSRTMVNTTK